MIKSEHLRSKGANSAPQSRREFLMRLGAASGVAGTWPTEGGEALAIESTPGPANTKAKPAKLFSERPSRTSMAGVFRTRLSASCKRCALSRFEASLLWRADWRARYRMSRHGRSGSLRFQLDL